MDGKNGNLLQVEDLRTYIHTKRGIVRAVDGVSFCLKPAETLGLVGESGCGKTMTCLSILRLVPEPGGRIAGGKILFEGDDLLNKSSRAMRRIRGRKISMILQDPMTSLNPVFTIGDQLGEPLRLHQRLRGKRVWEKAREFLNLVRIPAAESRLADYPHQMSGGMRQRVAGAIALSCQPSIVIADEPTTALDVTTQAQYLRLLRDIQEQRKFGMIFVTHNLGIVALMCDKVAVMYAGKIVEISTALELFDNPCHPYTKALLACIPKLEGESRRLYSIKGQPPDLATLSKGCSFAPRCPVTSENCWEESPREISVGKDHQVSCWRSVDSCGTPRAL